jgi:hypothetical protein
MRWQVFRRAALSVNVLISMPQTYTCAAENSSGKVD